MQMRSGRQYHYRVTAMEKKLHRLQLAYSVEKLVSRFSCSNFGGLKPSPDSFASL